MKLLLATIFFIALLLFTACENGVIISYNSDDLGSVRFIKSEKLQDVNGETLNCEYGTVSHQHNQEDAYYVYFTLSSKNETPINPQNQRFTNIADSLSIEFQRKQDNSSNYEIDDKVRVVGDIEFVSSGKNLKKEQNFNFLIDLMNKEDCNGIDDKNECSLSGGLIKDSFKDMLNQISTSLANAKANYDDPKSSFIEDVFLGVKYMALSTDNTESSWFHRLITSTYLYDMGGCNNITTTENKRKIGCWLKAEGTLQDPNSIAYRGLKSGPTARFHRKLWDGYIRASELLKEDTSDNKNLLFFVSGYEEGYYDTENVLNTNNQSEHTEDEFFSSINSSDNIPVFIAPQYRADLNSFPDNSGTAPDGTDIDNKFYKLACLTNGAYFPGIYERGDTTWVPTTKREYSLKGLMGHIKEASYGTWRVKVKIDKTSTDRIYEGGILIKAKDTKGGDITTSLVGYRIVR